MGMVKEALCSIADTFLSVVSPRTCVVCGRLLLSDEKVMCMGCLCSMPRGRDAAALAARLRLIADNGVAPAGFCAAWFDYDPASDYAALIRKAKYNGRPRQAFELGRMFGSMLVDASDEVAPVDDEAPLDFDDIIVEDNTARLPEAVPATLDKVDVLLPIPLHWTRRMRRGYNQSEEIARGLAEAGGMAVADNLIAVRRHSSQTHKGAVARRRNISGCMALKHPSELDGLHIVIVDDILTTGSTMAEAVQAISCSSARPASIGIIALGVTAR